MFNMILFHNNIHHLTYWVLTVFIWMLMNYSVVKDRFGIQEIRNLNDRNRRRWRWNVFFRSLFGASVVLILPGLHFKEIGIRLLLFFITGLLGYMLPFMRDSFGHSKRWKKAIVESEIIHNLIYILLSGILTNQLKNPLSFPRVLQNNVHYVALVSIFLSALIFLINGGTHIVRGILDKTGTVTRKVEGVDQVEYNQGRLIGNLERILIFLFVLLGRGVDKIRPAINI